MSPSIATNLIVFDGEQVLVDRFKPDRDCVAQARAQARWLQRLIEESSGRKVAVRPVVVFPGWFIEGRPSGGEPEVWVLEPKALPGFVAHEKVKLTPDDVRLVSYHLSRYVRTSGEG